MAIIVVVISIGIISIILSIGIFLVVVLRSCELGDKPLSSRV